jgi:capsid protein
MSSQRAFEAAGLNRTTGDWRIWDNDANIDWLIDARTIAARAWDQYRNDPVAAALISAKESGVFGARGLVYRSLYSEDEDNETSEAESEMRRKIEDVVHRYRMGTQADAAGQMTADEVARMVERAADLSGDGFLIRKWMPARPRVEFATCWEFIRHDRVANPPARHDDKTLYQGLALDPETSRPIGLWIAPPRRYGNAPSVGDAKEWTFVPMVAPDGTPNVIHRVALRLPGAYRGVSRLAPILTTSRQVKNLLDSYIIAKRIQACHPVFIECEDPVEAAKNDRNGAVFGTNTTIEPGKIYYVAMGCKPTFPAWQFNGQDMQAFLDTLYRNQFAALGFPIDVVLCQLGETNMAASRSAWQQYYRTCEILQDEHIRQVAAIMDECAIREAVARQELPAEVLTPRGLRSRYSRPPRAMPDPKKEAEAVAIWTSLGRDKTGLWAESGIDYRDSIDQRAEDDALAKAKGVEEQPLPGATPDSKDDNPDDDKSPEKDEN